LTSKLKGLESPCCPKSQPFAEAHQISALAYGLDLLGIGELGFFGGLWSLARSRR